MRKVILLFAFVMPLVSACILSGEGGSYTFFAYTEDGSKAYADDTYKVYWNADDRISILGQGTANAEYRFTGETGANSGAFEPAGSPVGSASTYYGVYPYRSTTSLNSGILSIELPSGQSYAAGSFGPGAGVMVAESSDSKLRFKNLCGLLVLRAYGNGLVSTVTVSGNAGERMAGTADVSFTDGVPSAVIKQGGAVASLEMICGQPVALGADAAHAAEFCFALPPVYFENGFTVTFTDDNGRSTTVSTAKSVDIRRNCVYRMAALGIDFTAPVDATVGSPLPLWQPGYLDIHSVNGGRGEAFYYIMPDGTTMLVDAAGAPPAELYDYGEGKSPGVPSKPSASVGSGTVIVDYIRHFAPPVAGGRLDYFMTSHYHGDHIGAWRSEYKNFGWLPYDKNGKPVTSVNFNTGGFISNGVAEVGMKIPMDKVFDRGDWSSRPSEEYYTSSGRMRYANYVNFLDYSARTYGTVRETLQIGHTDQLVLRHQPSAYGNFSIRTIASGGDIWTGSGTGVNTAYMPSAAEFDANHASWAVDENIFSNVFLLKYGAFDWFSGGDIQYTGRSTYAWKDIELPVSKVVGKVEAMKACHHSTKNTNSSDLLKALKPSVYIAGVWRDVQPNPATLQRVYAANPSVKVFTTNLTPSNAETLQDYGIDPSAFCATGGHVVIRVLPGGNSYYVYVLDDSDTEYRVLSIHGPFKCE